jgi:hypothetical protein
MAKFTLALPALLAAVVISGCGRPHSEEAAKSDKSTDLPVVTQSVALKAAQAASQLTGVATVLMPDSLVQIDADIRAAHIAADFSQGTAERYRATHALSRQTVENAERQAGTDATQQKLLETRLKHAWGDDAPFLDAARRADLIAELASGNTAIVRLDFPDVTGGQPHNVRVAPLSGGDSRPVKLMWTAPSGNQSMPGVSYFGLIDAGPGLRPGDRARLIAEASESSSGVIIPNSAIVIFSGQSWCYVETAPGKYERRPVTLDLPIGEGYLVRTGFTPGTRVVVRGASILLSREAGPGEDDEDATAKKPDDKKPDEKKSDEHSTEPPSGPAAASPSAKDDDKPEHDNAPADASGKTEAKPDSLPEPKPGARAASSNDKDPD